MYPPMYHSIMFVPPLVYKGCGGLYIDDLSTNTALLLAYFGIYQLLMIRNLALAPRYNYTIFHFMLKPPMNILIFLGSELVTYPIGVLLQSSPSLPTPLSAFSCFHLLFVVAIWLKPHTHHLLCFPCSKLFQFTLLPV